MSHNLKQLKGSNEFALLYAVDEAFSKGALVSLASALATTDFRRLIVYIAYDQEVPLGEHFWQSVRKIFEHWEVSFDKCKPLPIDLKRVASLPSFHTGSYLNYGRLVAFDSIPEELCLYLDADTLVLGDLEQLVDLYDSAMDCAAVLDERILTHAGDGYSLEEEVVAEDTPYFNSGVMVVNTERWRANNAVEAIVEVSKRCSIANYRDQTFLNILLYDKVQYLPSKWNGFTRKGHPVGLSFAPISGTPAILHYVGHHKPWEHVMMDLPNLLWYSFAAVLVSDEKDEKQLEWVSNWSRFKLLQSLGINKVRMVFYYWRYRNRSKAPRKLRSLIELYLIDEELNSVSKWLDARGLKNILPS